MVFLLISIVAGLLGFGGVSKSAAGVDKVLIVLILAIFGILVVSSLAGVSAIG